MVTDKVDLQVEIDENIYSEDCMQVYNRVIGNGFIMPGGLEATKVCLLSYTALSIFLLHVFESKS